MRTHVAIQLHDKVGEIIVLEKDRKQQSGEFQRVPNDKVVYA